MNTLIKLAPSILSADFSNLIKDIKEVESAGCEYLHIDVMDGMFVPNITLGPIVVKSLRKKVDMVFDVHLMIEEPDRYIKDFIDAGADLVTVHLETTKHLDRTVQLIKSNKAKVGVALNPATPVNLLEDIIKEIDMVLIMSVNPGFGGQSFIENSIKKIKEVRELIIKNNLDIDIQVDGGINENNIKEVVEAGANIIVAGSGIFGKENREEAVYNLRNKLC